MGLASLHRGLAALLPKQLAGPNMVAEGLGTTEALLGLAREHGMGLPIAEQVHSILHLGNAPKDAIRVIMEKPVKKE